MPSSAAAGLNARATLIAMTDHRVLAREIAAFEAHYAELVSTAVGKYALVYGDEVAAVHDTERLAITDGRNRFGYVPILVERIIGEGEAGPPVNAIRAPGRLGESLLSPMS